MAGTSIIFPDATPTQADVIATLWTPEGVAHRLLQEHVLGGTAAASIVNRAAPATPGVVIGAPAYSAHSVTVGAGGSGFNTGLPATEDEQTFVVVARGGATGGVLARTGFLGIMAGVNGDPWSFYNDLGGVAPAIPVTPSLGSGYQFVIGWGSAGGPGRIRSGQGGDLNATVTGTGNGAVGRRIGETVKIGGGVFAGQAEVAFAARVPALLTEVQMLTWYRTLRGDGTAAGSPLGVAVV